MKLEFFYLLKQCQPPCLCQIKSAHRGDEGGVINEDIMVFQHQDFFIQSSPGVLKTCHEILVLEVIGDCSRQRVGSVQQRVGSVHYQFKLPLEIFICEGI